MEEKKNKTNSGLLVPQKCGLCSQPGHNRGSKCCPVNIKKAQDQQLIEIRKSDSTQITANEKKQNDKISRSNAEQRRSFYSIEPPTQLSEEISSNPPNSKEEVAQPTRCRLRQKKIKPGFAEIQGQSVIFFCFYGNFSLARSSSNRTLQQPSEPRPS